MVSGWGYRGLSVLGTLVVTGIAVALANHPVAQGLFTLQIPYLSRLPAQTLTNGDLAIAYLTTAIIVFGSLFPLFKPRPRRILDTVMATQKRVVVAMLALATVGYFDYSYRLPRQTLILVSVVLLITLPWWFVWIRQQPTGDNGSIIVGDDPAAMADILHELDGEVLGYVSPAFDGHGLHTDGGQIARADRDDRYIGTDLRRLGGLARLDEVLVDYDISTAYLAFRSADRAEFFGALETCHEHGVAAKVHRDHVDSVLTEHIGEGQIVDVEIEPLDFQDYLLKRLFDVAFAWVGLVALSPIMVIITAAITLDDGGPILYKQERTAEFGKTFTVYKFRTMNLEGESPDPVSDEENDRITRVGKVLRQTHLDEIPQLWSIFVGKMSVVGPRAVWRDEERIIQQETDAWRQRWFVKPGLTGLAQIRDVTSEAPKEKLRSDLEYIRRQSFWFDLQIVIRQIWMVLRDAGGLVVSESADSEQDGEERWGE